MRDSDDIINEQAYTMRLILIFFLTLSFVLRSFIFMAYVREWGRANISEWFMLIVLTTVRPVLGRVKIDTLDLLRRYLWEKKSGKQKKNHSTKEYEKRRNNA